MNTSTRNALIALGIVVVAGAAGGAYLQFWAKDDVATNDPGQVAGEEDFSAVPDGMSEVIDVKLNESKKAFGVNINPVSVEEDSRCPADVQCIQAGTVRVQAMVTARGETTTQPVTFELNVPMTVGLDQVTLVAVEPQTHSDSQIAEGDYVFSFAITKGGASEYYKG
jgi:hypothetical protein